MHHPTTDRGRPAPRAGGRLHRVLVALAAGLVVALLAPTGDPAASADGTATTISLGAYVQPAPTPGEPNAAIAALDAGIGRHLAIYQTFTDWESSTGVAQGFPRVFARYVVSLGATPMVTWEPQETPTPGEAASAQPDFSLAEILTGRYDAYIRSWAGQVRAFGHVVYIRLMHEMNGEWYPWGYDVNGNTPAEYVAAWRHIVTLFQGEGVTNARFVWCASAGAWWDPAPFYPGDAYVSWIALDGYNRAATWQSFTQVLATRYAQITALTSLPVMIAETASLEEPGDPTGKADWITSAFLHEIPQNFPRVRIALYFDSPVGGPGQVLTSSPAALAAFAGVAASPPYQGPAPD